VVVGQIEYWECHILLIPGRLSRSIIQQISA